MGLLARLFGTPRIQVPAHTLGLLDFSGGRASALAAADRTALEQFFSEVKEAVREPPPCQLLLLYCTIGPDGTISNSRLGLREIIRDAGAPVVIVATPNSGESYTVAANKNKRYARANLVMTLDRKGDAFGSFWRRLIGDMKAGTPMPVAWVKLAPQVPGAEHTDCPEAIFACELGQVVFA